LVLVTVSIFNTVHAQTRRQRLDLIEDRRDRREDVRDRKESVIERKTEKIAGKTFLIVVKIYEMLNMMEAGEIS
jgi:hypothetical protein